MSEIQLEVGKTYEVREPEICDLQGNYFYVKIVSEYDGIFTGDDENEYFPNGRFLAFEGECYYDLVKEVTP
ncbi:hypothetical protein MUK70_11705 [Dyadobacter chenwenxiniae]|uniref:Uncharacterized protein n=1 Tax=Dyadobacter chenwenxiniae TaxID=2906456 RepID=A0A9X1TBK7_9BACT|nr:hypothetical protein [Dyadobacter chenwenxiniae]MCF0059906.1 hypothetical protein [Dyadobacter chenwenxiniae]UON85645.1 hypothetical protein MUK70_11705 [Dyadobacter chenwenxiniae]